MILIILIMSLYKNYLFGCVYVSVYKCVFKNKGYSSLVYE